MSSKLCMKRLAIAGLTLLVSCAAQAQTAGGPPPANGRGPTGQLVYPARGQSAAVVDRDRFECHDWARQQSGFDPTQPAPTTTAAAAVPVNTASVSTAQTSPTAGLLQGAAGGAAVAELADRDAGKGAAVGVLGASLRQQVKQRQAQGQAQAQQQQAQQQAAATQQQTARAQARGAYERGFAACMEARGYVVK